jgi:hypothetical protein
MSINILPGSSKTLDEIKGMEFVPHPGEGIVYLKLVMIKPETMKDGDPAMLVENTEGVVMCGQLAAIKKQIETWFNQTAKEYHKESK